MKTRREKDYENNKNRLDAFEKDIQDIEKEINNTKSSSQRKIFDTQLHRKTHEFFGCIHNVMDKHTNDSRELDTKLKECSGMLVKLRRFEDSAICSNVETKEQSASFEQAPPAFFLSAINLNSTMQTIPVEQQLVMDMGQLCKTIPLIATPETAPKKTTSTRVAKGFNLSEVKLMNQFCDRFKKNGLEGFTDEESTTITSFLARCKETLEIKAKKCNGCIKTLDERIRTTKHVLDYHKRIAPPKMLYHHRVVTNTKK
jgi:chaperonin cofactor prefoldin